ASGIVKIGQKQIQSTETLAAIRNRCSQPLSQPEIYRQLREKGLEYGESFQTMQSIWAGSQEALAELETKEDTDGYSFHPTLLDGCLQLIVVAFSSYQTQEKEIIYLPIGMDQF